MIPIVLFGANNPSGAAFVKQHKEKDLETWGRQQSLCHRVPHTFCDLSQSPLPNLKPISGILVSFAPIWLLAPFLKQITAQQPELLVDLIGIVACSSSSFMTKRFAFNNYDKKLAERLNVSHTSLIDTCRRLEIPFQIIAPTLVYGKVNCYTDKNISKIIRIMKFLPAILLPSNSGMRQPIHASQLAAVAKHQVSKMACGQWSDKECPILCLGGDEIISYEDMILQIQNKLGDYDSASRCQVIKIPDRIFYLMASPLIIINPKIFESVMRINSNLSGFTKVSEIIGGEATKFPVMPLSIGE